MDRELRAVDSENKKNLQSDVWRMQQLHRSLGNPKHPFSGFSTGNLKTLRDEPLARGIKIRDEFIKFYETHYSANRMKLVVLGRESLEQLQEWVESLFSAVKNTDLPQNRWDGLPAYTDEQLATRIFTKPVMQTNAIDIRFPYPDETELYDSQPSRYLSHLIGHEGPGSILAYVKAKGWAYGLSAGGMTICPGTAIFTISISLTPLGLKHYIDVVKAVFQYVSILRQTPPQQWIYDEMADMSAVDFKFKQKLPASRTTSSLSSTMQKPHPRDKILSGYEVLRRFDAAAISEGIKSLRPSNARMTLVTQDPVYEGPFSKEKWYGTEYHLEKIPQDLLSELEEAVTEVQRRPSELHLPSKNEFIPSRLDVERVPVKQPLDHPKLIRNDDRARIWYKKDDRFWVPQGNMQMTLRNPLCNLSSRTLVMAQVFVDLVSDVLNEYAYDAEIAGLEYDLLAYSAGFNLVIKGYNDKMHVLLEKVLSTMRDVEIREDRFEIVKDRLTRAYKNSAYINPYQQVGLYTRWLGEEKGFTREEYLQELPAIEASHIRDFKDLLLEQMHTEVLVHGNVHREDALKMTDLVERVLKPRPLPVNAWPIRRSIILPRGASYQFNKPLKDPSNINHCIQYVLQVGDVTDRDRLARLRLFAKMTEEAAFNQLRTIEQLGYVVFSGMLTQIKISAYHVLIQSERTPEYLESRIEAFLRGFKKTLADMSPDSFDGFKRSVINDRREKVKNLNQESNRFWGHVTNEMFFFDERDDDVAHLKPLTKQDMMDFFDEFINPDGQTRAKLAVHMIAQGSAEAIAESLHLSANEQKDKLLDTLGQLLSGLGVSVDPANLKQNFVGVDVSQGDQPAILDAVSSSLKQTAGLAAEQLETVLVEGKAALGQVLTSLGIKSSDAVNGSSNGETNGNGHARTPTRGAVLIEDVHAFKASMLLTTGATPMRDLSQFEDFEAKL